MKRIFSFFVIAAAAVVFLSCHYNFSAAAREEPCISAKACVLTEAETGKIIYSKDCDTKYPMASTTKIMSVMLCLESGGLDESFRVSSEAIKVEGSSMGLQEGDIVTKRALCYGMMLPSGNDAANAAAVAVAGTMERFADMMNDKAAELGLEKTFFATPSGLEGEGHGSSAYDMALLTSYALKNDEFRKICSCTEAEVVFGNPPCRRTLRNTNKLLTMYSGIIGVKTGFTDEAGRCLVSACEKNGVTLICVTLNDKNDWEDHMALYDYGFLQTVSEKAEPEGIYIDAAGADKEKIKAVPEKSFSFGRIKGDNTEISFEYNTKPFVFAGVRKGDKVGAVYVYYGEKCVSEIDLRADEDAAVKKCRKKNRFTEFLGSIKEKIWQK